MASVKQTLKQAVTLCNKAKILLASTLITAAMTHYAQAQTFGEWFSQKKTQKKYLLQQIAALEVYGGYLHNGYNIAKGGLGSISGYVGKEFRSHNNYYTHLKTVSIPVKSNPQVNAILSWRQDILNQVKLLKAQNHLTVNEKTYVSKVSDALLNDCDAQLNDLRMVLADQKTAMSDEERIRQIGRLHQAMQDNYRFVAGFRSHLQRYVRSKQQEVQDINTLNQLYATH